MGFCGVLVPEEHGGLGLGNVEAGTIMEEIGRNLTPSPFLSTAIVGVSALLRANGQRKSELLPKIAGGDLLMALAVDERAKHGPRQVALAAKRSGNGFALSGTKTFVVDGHVADLLIVAARTAGAPGETDGLTLFLVDPKTKGVDIERTIMVDSHNAARLTFDNVQVDADAVLGEVDGGWPVLEGVLNVGRGAVAAELVGCGEEAFGRTVSYLKERKQFGRAIGEFQALQHRAAHLYSEIEITRAAVLKALQQLDQKPEKAEPIVADRQGARRQDGDARRAGSRADAWRHRHDGRNRHRLVHEARPCRRRAFRRHQFPRRSPGAAEAILTTMSDAAAKAWPVMSLAEADARLNVPGSPFEWEEIDIRGVKTRVWKNAPRTLRDILLNGRAAFAARTFLVYQDDRTTFEGFARAALTIAHRLLQEGVTKGDRVAIAMRNLPEWPAAFYGAILVGAIATPLNAWWTGPELEYCAAGFWRQDRFRRFASVTSASPSTCTICPIFSASSFAAPPSPSHIRM